MQRGRHLHGDPRRVRGARERLGRLGRQVLLEAVERGEAGEPIEFTVTGIVASAENLIVDEAFQNGYSYFTAALLDHTQEHSSGYHGAEVKLEGGAVDEQPFRRAVEALVPDETIEFQSRAADRRDGRARRAPVHGRALGVRGGGRAHRACSCSARRSHGNASSMPSTMVRAVHDRSARAPALRAGRLRTAVFAVPGVVCAVLVAIRASPLMPIGPAGRAEVQPGIDVDPVALGLGALGLTRSSSGARVARGPAAGVRRPGSSSGCRGPGVSAGVVARVPLGPSACNGVRFAMEPGRGRTAVPVRTTLVAATVAVLTVVAALTFAAGLDRLLATPRLFGVTWQLEAEGGGETPEEVASDARTIERSSRPKPRWRAGPGSTRAGSSSTVATSPRSPSPSAGHVVPTVDERPAARRRRDEVALGRRTLDQLGRRDRRPVTARFREESRQLVVVGRVVLPGLGELSRW